MKEWPVRILGGARHLRAVYIPLRIPDFQVDVQASVPMTAHHSATRSHCNTKLWGLCGGSQERGCSVKDDTRNLDYVGFLNHPNLAWLSSVEAELETDMQRAAESASAMLKTLTIEESPKEHALKLYMLDPDSA